MTRDFGFGQLSQLSGASENELVNWLRAGALQASIRDDRGRGRRRRFSFDDVVLARVLSELRPFRMEGSVLRVIGERVRTALQKSTPSEVILLGGGLVHPQWTDPASATEKVSRPIVWIGTRAQLLAAMDLETPINLDEDATLFAPRFVVTSLGAALLIQLSVIIDVLRVEVEQLSA